MLQLFCPFSRFMRIKPAVNVVCVRCIRLPVFVRLPFYNPRGMPNRFNSAAAYDDFFHISPGAGAEGNFAAFGHPEISVGIPYDEDFVRAGFFFDVFQQQVEFGGVVAVVFAVGKERRAVADLSQFEQAVQDVQLAFFDAVGGDLVQQLFAVAFFGRVVEFALRRAHVAVEDAFGFGRQFGRDLFFAAPQDEGVDEFGKERGAGFVFVFVDGVGEGAFEVAVQ